MYYPKSQIVTNLYTNGQEYAIASTGRSYIGNYWKTSDGKLFTGKTPEDKNIQELIKIEQNPGTNTDLPENSNYVIFYGAVDGERPLVLSADGTPYNTNLDQAYVKLKNVDINSKTLIPSSYPAFPTSQDYELGEFTRYFCKKTNELRYIEINKDTYEKITGQDPTYLWQLYIPFKYQWIISGSKETVYKTNEQVTTYMITKFKFPAFNKFLKEDYLKFWKPE